MAELGRAYVAGSNLFPPTWQTRAPRPRGEDSAQTAAERQQRRRRRSKRRRCRRGKAGEALTSPRGGHAKGWDAWLVAAAA